MIELILKQRIEVNQVPFQVNNRIIKIALLAKKILLNFVYEKM